mgnify:CR=1 FL=1
MTEGRFLYSGCCISWGEAHGRDGKVIEKEHLKFSKGNRWGSSVTSTQKISGKRSKKETAVVMPHSWSIT